MLLRLIRGSVSAGREADFIAVCRQQVAEGARLPGLAAFFVGIDAWKLRPLRAGVDVGFVRVGSPVVGEPDQPVVVRNLEGDRDGSASIDMYSTIDPVFRGIVFDAPGGVVQS